MRLYKDNLKGDETPDLSEGSDDVIRYWFNPTVRYENEFQEASGCEAYCRRTSERVFVRNLLGLSDLEKDHAQSLAEKYPFGTDGPTLASLLSPSVFAAMALVPITPLGNSGNPILARLYCVQGLEKGFFPAELNADDLSGGREYSWFLAGLDAKKSGKRIGGRSWLLAAELLHRVMTSRNRATARNLMTKFIVTGNVDGDRIIKVEIGRKAELERKKVFSNLKWIVPEENEIMGIPSMKIKNFKTVDEAAAYIERMQNAQTDLLTKLSLGDAGHNVDAYLPVLQCGADPTETSKDDGLNARQRVKRNHELEIIPRLIEIFDTLVEHGVSKSAADKLITPIEDTVHGDKSAFDKERMLSHYGCIPEMYFMFAKLGDREMIQMLNARGFDINATDSTGATALDFAIEVKEDPSVSSLLREFGAKRRGVHELKSEYMYYVVSSILSGSATTEMIDFLIEAMEQSKICPNEVLDLPEYDLLCHQKWSIQEEENDSEYVKFHYFEEIRVRQVTLHFAALLSKNERLIEASRACGGDDSKILLYSKHAILVKKSYHDKCDEMIGYPDEECRTEVLVKDPKFKDEDFYELYRDSVFVLNTHFH